MDASPPPDSAELATRARTRKTLIFLVLAMFLMGVIGLGMALATVKYRRTRDITGAKPPKKPTLEIPGTRISEAALLNRMPETCRQVLVCKPGWNEFRPFLADFPELERLGQTKEGPTQWAAGMAGSSGSPFLVGDWGQSPGARTGPPGWTASGELWLGQNPPPDKPGVPAGLNLMVRTRIGQNPDQVAIWAAGMGIPWRESWGHLLWRNRLSQGSKPMASFESVTNWVTWIERQPDRYILRAELECPTSREAKTLEKTLEENQANQPDQWAGFRFMADGPWISLQAPLGPEPAGRR